MESTQAGTLFRNVVNTRATIDVKQEEIVVSFGRRTNDPLMIAANFAGQRQSIPWPGNRHLRSRFF